MFLRFRFNRWLMWMALAAAAMYLFDPERGERRRRQLRAKVDSYRRTAERTADRTGTDIRKASG